MRPAAVLLSFFYLMMEGSNFTSGSSTYISHNLEVSGFPDDYFTFSSGSFNWKDSDAQCRSSNSKLATFRKYGDQVKGLLNHLSTHHAGEQFWIGYTGWQGQWRNKQGNTLRGTGGLSPWSGSTTADENNKDCMVVDSIQGFSDANCGIKKRYICFIDSWHADGRCGNTIQPDGKQQKFLAPTGELAICSCLNNGIGQGSFCNATGHCAGNCVLGATWGCTFCPKDEVYNADEEAVASDWSSGNPTRQDDGWN